MQPSFNAFYINNLKSMCSLLEYLLAATNEHETTTEGTINIASTTASLVGAGGESSSPSGNTPAIIGGAVAGGVILLVALLVVAFFIGRHHGNKKGQGLSIIIVLTEAPMFRIYLLIFFYI